MQVWPYVVVLSIVLSDPPASVPCNWEIVLALGTVVLALGTVVLVVIAYRSARYAKDHLDDFRREARIKHLIDLLDQFEHKPMAEYRKSLAAKRVVDGVLQPLDASNPPPELHDILNFFEHIGYLLEGDYLSLDGVSVEFHYWILRIWADAKRFIKSEQSDNELYYRHLDKMAERLLAYKRPGTGKLPLPGPSDILDFYVEESRLQPGSPIPRQSRRRTASVGMTPLKT